MEWIILAVVAIAVASLLVVGRRRRRALRDRTVSQPDIGKMAHAATIAEAQTRSRARTVDPGAVSSS